MAALPVLLGIIALQGRQAGGHVTGSSCLWLVEHVGPATQSALFPFYICWFSRNTFHPVFQSNNWHFMLVYLFPSHFCRSEMILIKSENLVSNVSYALDSKVVPSTILNKMGEPKSVQIQCLKDCCGIWSSSRFLSGFPKCQKYHQETV